LPNFPLQAIRDELEGLKVDHFSGTETQAEHEEQSKSLSSPSAMTCESVPNVNEGDSTQDLGTSVIETGQSSTGQQHMLQHSQESESSSSIHSINVNLPPETKGQVAHMHRHTVQAMITMNMLTLCAFPKYRKEMGEKIAAGLKTGSRDSYDAAGKFALCRKLMSLGVKASQIFIDPAQAGGLCGRDDGFIHKSKVFIEIKSARAKSRGNRKPGQNARPQFQASAIRDGGWGQLILVCREQDPSDWTSIDEYDECGFWLGIVLRDVYEQARVAVINGKPRVKRQTEQVVVSPFTDAEGIKGLKSWLSPHIKWIRFRDLTREWCEEHLLL
jgi:hypothetical protein